MRKLEVGHEYRNDDLGYSVDGAIFVEVDSPTQVHAEYVDSALDTSCPISAVLVSRDAAQLERLIYAVRAIVQQQWAGAYVDWAGGCDPDEGICYAITGDPQNPSTVTEFLDYITHMTDRANYGSDSIYDKALAELGA